MNQVMLKLKVLNKVIWNPIRIERVQSEGKDIIVSHAQKDYIINSEFVRDNTKFLNISRLIVTVMVFVFIQAFFMTNQSMSIFSFFVGLFICLSLYFVFNLLISYLLFSKKISKYIVECKEVKK